MPTWYFVIGTSHGYAERALSFNVLSAGHQKVILQNDQEPSIIDGKRKAATSEPKSSAKKVPLETAPHQQRHRASKPNHPRAGSSNQGHHRTTDRCDDGPSQLNLEVVWTLTTFHVRSHGMTADHRISGKPFKLQIAAFGEQMLFKPHKTSGPLWKTRCEMAGRLLARIHHANW